MNNLLSRQVTERHNMVNQDDLNRQEELYIMNLLLQFMQSKGRTFAIKEMPITSVGHLSKGQSVPDALLDDGTWIEITTFSRTPDMYKRIAKRARGKTPHTLISGPYTCNLDAQLLVQSFTEALQKKIQKNYEEFAKIVQAKIKGILLIVFVCEDPCFDDAHKEFLSIIKDKHVIGSWGIENSCFNQVIFGAFIVNQEKYVFDVIVDSEIMESLRDWNDRKQAIRENSFLDS